MLVVAKTTVCRLYYHSCPRCGYVLLYVRLLGILPVFKVQGKNIDRPGLIYTCNVRTSLHEVSFNKIKQINNRMLVIFVYFIYI